MSLRISTSAVLGKPYRHMIVTLATAFVMLAVCAAASAATVLDYGFQTGVTTRSGCALVWGSSPATSASAGIVGGPWAQTTSGCDTGWTNPGFTTNFINDSTNFAFFSFTVTHPVSIDSLSVTGWTNPSYWTGAAGYAVRISPQNAPVPVPGTAFDASGWAQLGVLPGSGAYSGVVISGPGVLDPGTYTIAFPGASTPQPGTTQLFFNEVSLQGEAIQEPTQTALSSSLNPSIYGHSVTLTATVTGSESGQTPTGSVTFMDGSQSLGTATIDGSGAASLTTAALGAGSHQITASYSGDEFDHSSSQMLTQVVQTATKPGCPDPAGAYNQGFNSGFNSGFNAGFNTGFQRGFAAGFGRPSGHAAGIGAASPSFQARGQAPATPALPPACDQAFNQGFNTGFHPGFNSAFGKGFNSGFSAGYKARHTRL